jgi:hypothetical protein
MLISDPFEALPIDDLFVHHAGLDCWCVPEENDDGTIVHNAADQRELFATGKRKPS